MFQVEALKRVLEDDEPGLVNQVLKDFGATMLGPMIERYSLFPAKGTTVERFAHNADQTMLSHLLNGIFPALNFVREALRYNPPSLRRLDDTALRIYMLAYSMHDLDKILNRNGLNTRHSVQTAGVYREVMAELARLNGRAFLPDLEQWIAEITWLAVNTQRERDINLAETSFISLEILQMFEDGLGQLKAGVQPILRDLCTFSDVIAYAVKSPEEALSGSAARRLARIMQEIYGDFSFVYHKLSEVRGFLTNLVNNAVMGYLKDVYQDQQPLIPFLFFPNGVVYLNPQRRRPTPLIDRPTLDQAVKAEIREACHEAVQDGAGLGFSPLGLLKYPGYFHDFLSPADFLLLFARKTLSDTKENVAVSTLDKMREMQAGGRIPATVELDYFPSSRVAAFGRFLINYTRLVDENLKPETAQQVHKRLAERWDETSWGLARQIPSSGGLDYRFYWLAAQYLKVHPLSPDELAELFEGLINEVIELGGPQLETAPGLQGPYLSDLPLYLEQNLSFGFDKIEGSKPTAGSDWQGELAKYVATKQPREAKLACTLCNGAYPTAVQEDASVLFQPWVYKNRLPLYKGSNAGGICSICSLELMLRQLLLSDRPGPLGRVRVTGKKYEAQELKYFFIYPAFFFTTQTARLSYYLLDELKTLRLFELGKRLTQSDTITTADILGLSFFNPKPRDLRDYDKEVAEEKAEKGSMFLLNRYERQHYPGFMFFAKKTFSRDSGAAATTASWVEAAWLGMALPLIIGARVVVSEMYSPLFNSAADFKETVVLDAPHQAVRYLLPTARLRLDQLYGPQEERNDRNELTSGSLAAFSRVIEIHLDTEASQGDPRLGRFNRIARELATDRLWVFSFLQEQVRERELTSMPLAQARHYTVIYKQIGGTMTYHEEAVKKFRKFYNPYNFKKDTRPPKTAAIVRPIDIAAKTIIQDSLNVKDDPEAVKLEMVGKLRAWLEIVHKGEATGRAEVWGATTSVIKSEQEQAFVRDFVNYFYDVVFIKYAEGQRALLNNRLNRFKNGCEAAYVDLRQKEREARQAAGQSADDVPDSTIPIEED